MSTRCRLGVFVDKDIPTAADWKGVLLQKVARSKVMVCLLCGEYFREDKEWTRKEIALMMAREEHLNLAGAGPQKRIIIPIRIRDGDWWPDAIKGRQFDDFSECYNSDFYDQAPTGLEFANKIKALANTIGEIVREAPDYDPEFETLDHTEWYNKLIEKPENLPGPPSMTA